MNITNYTTIMGNFLDWSTQGFLIQGAMGLFWIIIICTVSTYLFMKNQSVVVFAVAILIFLAAFSNALVGVDAMVNFLQIVVALIFTVLLIVFFTKVRR